MLSVFDLDTLRDLLKDFYTISNIRITVFDETMKELVSYPPEVAPYCSVIRGTRAGIEACMKCDRDACERATKKHDTYIYKCHAGFTEAITPLYVEDILVGYLLIGHVFSYPDHDTGWRSVEQATSDLPVNTRMLRKAIYKAVPIDEEYIRSADKILHAVASYLIMERMATLKEEQLAVRLNAYISTHYTESINASVICDALSIGRTQLYKLSKQMYGCGIAEHIRDLRMELARKLLKDRSNATIDEIAGLCGYSDYNYFISVFSRENGQTPGAFRKLSNAK